MLRPGLPNRLLLLRKNKLTTGAGSRRLAISTVALTTAFDLHLALARRLILSTWMKHRLHGLRRRKLRLHGLRRRGHVRVRLDLAPVLVTVVWMHGEIRMLPVRDVVSRRVGALHRVALVLRMGLLHVRGAGRRQVGLLAELWRRAALPLLRIAPWRLLALVPR